MDREELLFLENFEKKMMENPSLKPFFYHILCFGQDTNLLVMNAKLESSHCFEFNKHFNHYVDLYLYKKSNDFEEVDEKEKFCGIEVTQYLCSMYHTSISNGFKVACESGNGILNA